MRSLLLLFVAISASADCRSHLLYSTADYIVSEKIDDGALYVSLLLANDIERIDLATGTRTIVATGVSYNWDVQHGFLATPGTVGRPNATHIRVRDGYVYWLEDDAVLRRILVGGGAAETIAEHVTQYTLFENRVVFISDGKLFWKQLMLTLPPLFLADGDALDSVASDGVLITRYIAGPTIYDVRAEVLRVSWSGDVEKIYEAASGTYHNVFRVTASSSGSTVYIVKRNTYDNALIVIRNGVASQREKIIGEVDVLDAKDNTITYAQWGVGRTGLHEVVELCTITPRSRVVR